MNLDSRKYPNKDVDMLLASSAIIESAILNKSFLQLKRPSWADPFFEDRKEEIDQVINTRLGIDSAKLLRLATQQVYQLQNSGTTLLSEAKVQIEEDFKSDKPRRDELLTMLGFRSYYTAATKNGDQEALINLFYQFKTNLAPEVKQEIVNKGISEVLLNSIIDHADKLKNSDVFQELTKAVKKTQTAETIAVFNDIYDKSISIAKIARKFYNNDKARMDMFSYTKITKTINRQAATATPVQ